ncbi:Alpha-1,2-mannosyltransferase ALG9, partial [Stegodyphus mimosarum]
MIPLILIDSKHFGKFVIAPLNIVMYNVFTSHGPDLYGTEPCTFYFLNGILNFNVGFICALLAAPILILNLYLEGNQKKPKNPSALLYLAPMYLWMIVFFPLAHKEERFLFPIYPLICFAGAFAVDCIQKIYHQLFHKKIFANYLEFTSWISIAFCAIYCLFSLSRTVVVYKGYRAPIETFMELG